MDNSAKPCFQYVRNGRCKFGDSCKYSHDTTVLNRARGNLSSSSSSPQESHNGRLTSSSSQQSTRTQNVANRANRGNQPIPNSPLSSSATQNQHRSGKKKKTDGRPRHDEAAAGYRDLLAAERVHDEAFRRGGGCTTQNVDALLQEVDTQTRKDAQDAERVRHEAAQKLRTAQEIRVRKLEKERRTKENDARVKVQQAERRKKENEARVNAERQRMADLERRRQAEEERTKREQESRRQEEARRLEEEAQRRMQETLARRTRMEAEARETFQKVVDGSLVTFTAGLDIRRIVTGFESCKVVVKGLPLDIRPDEILRLLMQQGLDETQFFVVDIWRQGGKQDFMIIAHNDAAEVLADRMDDLELRGERVELEFGVFNGMGKMGAQQNDSSNLFVSFWAPSTRCAASYANAQTAQAKMRQLRGHLEGGRQLMLVAGRDADSIVINNLPRTIGDDRIRELAGTVQVKRLPTSSFEVDVAIQLLREFIAETAGDVTLDTISKGDDKVGLVSLRVRCMSWDDAKNLHDSLERYQLPYIWRLKLRLRLPDPMFYTIFIPPGQYRAQETIWTSLNDTIKDHSACRLVIKRTDRDYRVQVAGSDKLAVGALKVRVESIAAGSVIPGWHPTLARMQPALVQAIEETQAFMKTDARKRTVKLYGAPKALEAATTIVREEIERLNGMEITIKVPPSAIRYFRQQGLRDLQELLGNESNVSFDVVQRAVVVKGGEQAKRYVYGLINQARCQVTTVTDAQACPICYDSPTSPRTFLCGHIYCTNCLHHFFSSAGDDFPLVCMGDEAKCREPFSIAVMKEFLAPEAFSRLVDGAFSAYIEKRPQEFQPCRTPDCGQIYRRLQQEGELHCPSCFSVVCGACGEDSHAGMNCETAKARGNQDEQERLSQLYFQTAGDVKQCPRCSTWMSKISGCNHMQCKCGAHVCWRCLSTFETSAGTYAHMTAMHGGYYEPEPAPAPAPARAPAVVPAPAPNPQYVPPALHRDPFLGADYRQQAELLAEVQNRRAVQARLTTVRRLPDPIQYNRVYVPRARTPPPPPRQENQSWCAIM